MLPDRHSPGIKGHREQADIFYVKIEPKRSKAGWRRTGSHPEKRVKSGIQRPVWMRNEKAPAPCGAGASDGGPKIDLT
jgi:hypothetical protein